MFRDCALRLRAASRTYFGSWQLLLVLSANVCGEPRWASCENSGSIAFLRECCFTQQIEPPNMILVKPGNAQGTQRRGIGFFLQLV